jgi:ParB family transcriptional regulator, chromosome partitioning protein
MENLNVCNKIVMKKTSEIKPYIRNPRKNDKTVNLLVEMIPKVGFNVPLVIDKNGIIVKGHARFFASIKLGMKELPCIVTDADEEAIKLDRIADNRISEFSEWASEDLLHELDMLTLDFASLEFAMPNAQDLGDMSDFGEEDRTSQSDIEKAQAKQNGVAVKPPNYYKIACEKCGHIQFVKADSAWKPE